MGKHFLTYWKPTTADINLSQGGLLNHAASNQFYRVEVGDVLWIVTVRDGVLYLLGRIVIGQITDQRGASRIFKTSNLWEADFHVIAEENSAEPINYISIQQIAVKLRVVSTSGNDRLLVSDGRVNAQQLQTMRVLTPDSMSLLEDVLGESPTPKTPARKSKRKRPNERTSNESEVREGGNSMSVTEALHTLQAAGRKSSDLIKGQYRDSEQSGDLLEGLCYVISECIYHLFPGTFTPYRISWGDGRSHWFLRWENGEILDGISDGGMPCCEAEDYRSSRRTAFFTRKPSKRALALLQRAGLCTKRN